MSRKALYEQVIAYFREAMPDARTELHYQDAYQLLVAVMLSAQCTDKRVNQVTPALFEAFPTVNRMAEATPEAILHYISSCSYPNSKSRHLWEMARMVVDRFQGEIPQTAEQLQQLPGVGRKTANVMLAVMFDRPALAVDTHVFRVANRIGLAVDARTPLEVEKQLTQHIPVSLWSVAHHWLILHGRYVCTARRPACQTCGLSAICHYARRQKDAKLS